MFKRELWVAMVSVAAAVTLAVPGTSLAATPINLLLLGDSITRQGHCIGPLMELLSTNGYAPTVIANEGHDAYLIQNTPYPWPDYRSGVANQVKEFMKHPGVDAVNTYVLLMIGVNDVDINFKLKSTDDPNVQTRMGDLITKIGKTAPRAHLIVAQIVPNITSKEKDAAVKLFNADVAVAVAKAKKAGMKVSLVNMYNVFSPAKYQPYTDMPSPLMADRLHPDQAAGKTMAQVWFDGIQAVRSSGTGK